MAERRFEGVWIPAKLWLTKGLTAVEKCLLVEIHSLDASEKHCYASNAFLAEFLGVSEDTVTRGVKKLVDLKLIEVKSRKTPKGTERVIISRLDSEVGTPQNAETPTTQNQETPTPQNAEHSILLPLGDLNSTKKVSVADQALAYLNEKTGSRFKSHKGTGLSAIVADGTPLETIKAVIDRKYSEWWGTEQAQYLRPSTLFRVSNFEGYVNALRFPGNDAKHQWTPDLFAPSPKPDAMSDRLRRLV